MILLKAIYNFFNIIIQGRKMRIERQVQHYIQTYRK